MNMSILPGRRTLLLTDIIEVVGLARSGGAEVSEEHHPLDVRQGFDTGKVKSQLFPLVGSGGIDRHFYIVVTVVGVFQLEQDGGVGDGRPDVELHRLPATEVDSIVYVDENTSPYLGAIVFGYRRNPATGVGTAGVWIVDHLRSGTTETLKGIPPPPPPPLLSGSRLMSSK